MSHIVFIYVHASTKKVYSQNIHSFLLVMLWYLKNLITFLKFFQSYFIYWKEAITIKGIAATNHNLIKTVIHQTFLKEGKNTQYPN